MKVKILGCHGGTAPGYRTSCYQINDRFLIDAGSVCSALSPRKQMEITDVLLTHPHIDHVKDLCFLVENTFRPDRKDLVLRSTQEILDDIHKHLFNDVLWPDFTKIPVDTATRRTLLKFEALKPIEKFGDISVRYVKVNHPGHAVGYILDDGDRQVVFSGDTGPTEALWHEANKCPNLEAVFTEISFPNRMDGLARVSGHFTTAQLLSELDKLEHKDIPIYIAHFKPLFFEELMDEFHRMAPDRVRLLHQDDEYVFN